jgi:hypothetical protein
MYIPHDIKKRVKLWNLSRADLNELYLDCIVLSAMCKVQQIIANMVSTFSDLLLFAINMSNQPKCENGP